MTALIEQQRPAPPRRLVLWLVLGGLVLTYGVLSHSGVLSAAAVAAVRDAAMVLASLAAGLLSVATARRHPPRSSLRWAWYAFAGGAFSWLGGITYLLLRDVVGGRLAALPEIANWLFFGLAPGFAIGTYLLRAEAPTQLRALKRLTDLGLVASAMLVVSVLILMEPILGSGVETRFVVSAVVDPAAFLSATLFLVAVVWFRDLGHRRGVGLLLLASIAVHSIGVLVFFRRVLAEMPGVVDMGVFWLAGFALHVAAAFEHRDLAAPPADRRRHARKRLQMAEAVLPAVCLFAMVCAIVAFRAAITPRVITVAGVFGLCFALLLALREWLAYRSERDLYDRLERSTAVARHLQSASPAVLFVAPLEAPYEPRSVTENAEAEFGIAAADPWRWSERVHPEDLPRLLRALERVVEEGHATLEYRLREGDGEHRWVYQRALRTALLGEGEEEIVGSIVDIAERKEIERRMLENQRLEALGRLSGGIAHDFNNLLTAVLGYTELELLQAAQRGGSSENLELIRGAAQRAAKLTSQLLAFGRKQTLAVEPIDVCDTVRQMATMVKSVIGSRIELEVVVPPQGAAIVVADAAQLEQVVMNLILNARDAMPKGGRIVVAVERLASYQPHDRQSREEAARRKAPGWVVLSVTDNGTGMDEAVASRVFEPFYTTKPVGAGTGLGLAMIHGVVRQHGGFVELDTELGRGTCFRVVLPAAPGSLSPSGEVAVVLPEALSQGHETVLVVDAENAVRSLVRDALQPAGYRVLCAASGDEALEQAEQADRRIDVALVDERLAGIDAPELARRLRARRPDLQVIYTSTRVAERLGGSGARHVEPVLAKPISLATLEQTLRSALDRRFGVAPSAPGADERDDDASDSGALHVLEREPGRETTPTNQPTENR